MIDAQFSFQGKVTGVWVLWLVGIKQDPGKIPLDKSQGVSRVLCFVFCFVVPPPTGYCA